MLQIVAFENRLSYLLCERIAKLINTTAKLDTACQSRGADSIKAENKALQDIDLTLPEMLTLLSAFCEAGDPNGDGRPKWTPYDQSHRALSGFWRHATSMKVLNDQQVRVRKIIGEMKFSGSRRPMPIANTPLHLSASPSELRRSAPALGEHTAEVLSELGFSPEEIESFEK